MSNCVPVKYGKSIKYLPIRWEPINDNKYLMAWDDKAWTYLQATDFRKNGQMVFIPSDQPALALNSL